MNFVNKAMERELKRRMQMTDDEIRMGELKDKVKKQLLNKNIINKSCRLSLVVLIMSVIITIGTLAFKFAGFDLSGVWNILKLLMLEAVFIVIVMTIQIKNEDIVINRFLDELENLE